MNAADLLVKSLENEGVKYAFGISGEELREDLQHNHFIFHDQHVEFALGGLPELAQR